MKNEFQNPVRAVILAAGQGKRMKSAKAKVLHELLGKPILERVLDAVNALAVEHAHVVIGHNASQIEEFLHKAPRAVPTSTHLQQPQLGTGHAVMQVTPALASFNGTLLVLVGDAPLMKASTLESFVRNHQQQGATVSLLTTVVEDPRSYGRIVRDKNGNVKEIVEDKDATAEQREIREINPAIYCLEWPQVQEGLTQLKNDNKQGEYYLTDLVAWAGKNGLNISSTGCDWREVSGINSPHELAEAMRFLRDEIVARLGKDEGVTIIDPLSTWIAPEATIGSDTVIYPGTFITGPVKIGSGCVIGPHSHLAGDTSIGNGTQVMQSVVANSRVGENCKVGPFAHIRDGVEVSEKCRIGNFVELKNSQIGVKTNVSHLSYIGDATLGSEVNIGAGTITANFDKLSGKKSHTVIGDDSSTGSNSVLVAPVVLGKGAMVGAGSVVTKDVPDGALAVSRARQENKDNWVARRKAMLSASIH